MAEIVVMQQGGPRQRMLEIGESQTVGDSAADHRNRGVLILTVNRVDEGVGVEADAVVAERIVGLALHVVRGVGHALDETNELYFGIAGVFVIKLEPIGHAGIGMGPAELHLLPGPVDGQAQRIQRIGAEPVQARDLPRDRAPTKRDWARLSSRWGERLDRRIADLQNLRDRLDGCIGCGCLSMKHCALYNPEDTAASAGSGPRYLLGDSPDDG